MKRRPSTRHLDTPTALDYLEGRLAGSGRDAVEAHIGEPCPTCRERVRALGALMSAMRADRTPEVPAFLRERALSVFVPAAHRAPAGGLLERLAEILFDSLAAPIPATARRSVGEARRLRYALDGVVLEMEIEVETASLRTLRGRLDHVDAALCTLEARIGAETREAAFGADGTFALAGLPAGTLTLAVSTPDGRWQLPALEV